LVSVLATRYPVRVVAGRARQLSAEPWDIPKAQLWEVPLALEGRRPWILTGPLRLLQLNLAGVWDWARRGARLVVFSDVTYCLPGVMAKLLRGIPCAYNSQEIIWANEMPRPISALFRRLERMLLQRCDLWIVASEARARVVLQAQRMNRDYLVIENLPLVTSPPDLVGDRSERRARLGLSPEERVVMFQGNLFRKRGLEELVEAAQGASFHVVVQGGGPLQGMLTRRSAPNLHYLEPCPNREALGWVAIADLAFVYYGENDLNSAYACSGKFYNAVYAGVPVLCNRLPAFLEFAERHGGVAFLESLAPDGLRERITQILQDPELRRDLARQMRQAALDLSRTPREENLLRAVEGALAPLTR
jgi:glycosyltransferase involved in cell wall biosynthesis